jgi:hypothetical protein
MSVSRRFDMMATRDGVFRVPGSLVVKMADRVWRLTPEHRRERIFAAVGRVPDTNKAEDIAIEIAFRSHRGFICRIAGPDDPIYREGPRGYSPHWAQGLLRPDAQRSSPGPVSQMGPRRGDPK